MSLSLDKITLVIQGLAKKLTGIIIPTDLMLWIVRIFDPYPIHPHHNYTRTVLPPHDRPRDPENAVSIIDGSRRWYCVPCPLWMSITGGIITTTRGRRMVLVLVATTRTKPAHDPARVVSLEEESGRHCHMCRSRFTRRVLLRRGNRIHGKKLCVITTIGDQCNTTRTRR